jgi:hypothetical protein
MGSVPQNTEGSQYWLKLTGFVELLSLIISIPEKGGHAELKIVTKYKILNDIHCDFFAKPIFSIFRHFVF